MIDYYNTECPKVGIDEVRILLAEDSQSKARDIKDSLNSYGLVQGDNLTISRTLEEAGSKIQPQTPGTLSFNVLLLDGELDSSKPYSLGQGSHLLSILFGKYVQPITSVMNQAEAGLKEKGLNSQDRAKLLQHAFTYEVAARRMKQEVLMIGVSRVKEGSLKDPAQIPWLWYEDVGPAVYQAILTAKERKRIEREAKYSKDMEHKAAAAARAAQQI